MLFYFHFSPLDGLSSSVAVAYLRISVFDADLLTSKFDWPVRNFFEACHEKIYFWLFCGVSIVELASDLIGRTRDEVEAALLIFPVAVP